MSSDRLLPLVSCNCCRKVVNHAWRPKSDNEYAVPYSRASVPGGPADVGGQDHINQISHRLHFSDNVLLEGPRSRQ